MAFTDRLRRQAFDNIAAGSAAGRELLIAGDTVSVQGMAGGGQFVSTSNTEAGHTNIAAGTSVSEQLTRENIQAGVVVGDERPGGA